MRKTSGIWMAALTLTAIVMVVVLLAAPQRSADAVMLNAQAGFALMTAGTPGGDEFLIVVDKTTQKMVIYKLNGNSLDLAAGSGFGRFFGVGGRR
jgi:hypothetical protein